MSLGFFPHPSAPLTEGITEHLSRSRNFVVEESQDWPSSPGRRLPPVAPQARQQSVVERGQGMALPVTVRVAAVGRNDVRRAGKPQPECRTDPGGDRRAASPDPHDVQTGRHKEYPACLFTIEARI